MKFVSIVMGSKSDYGIMSECADTLQKFGVPYELIISSAHRSPERTKNYMKEAEAKGAQVFIAAAGMAAHLEVLWQPLQPSLFWVYRWSPDRLEGKMHCFLL